MSDSKVTINVGSDAAAETTGYVALEARVALVEKKLDRNNELTEEIHAAWLPIKDALETFAKVGRFLGACGRFIYRTLRVLALVAGSLTAIWVAVYTYMHGLPPK